jgi:DNA (cytosine-5)-methyltransferase 1
MIQTYYEFFAGGGMARLGLGAQWHCLLANDIDQKKASTYRDNFGIGELVCKDIYGLASKEMPGSPLMAWASFPCQDLSLAGNRIGLAGERSGTFWGFWTAIHKMKIEGRAPPILVLENVCGTLTSNGGRDFNEICRALSGFGYDFGAVVVDASHFVPQSRPRLFIICISDHVLLSNNLAVNDPVPAWTTGALMKAYGDLSIDLKARWKWWNLPASSSQKLNLDAVIEKDSNSIVWHSPAETRRLMSMMSSVNRQKVKTASKARHEVIGALYKRTRVENGNRIQRAEVRFDGLAGCLRTPGGGSSRQSILVVNGSEIKSRLLTVREAARLMGVPDTYIIPENYNDGYHIFGDGLAVPVVRFLREYLLDPLSKCAVRTSTPQMRIAAE